jgi:hypothetical protein
MKKKIFNVVTLAFVFFVSTQITCAQESKCWSVVGYWESFYFEYKSLDYTHSHQFKMRFDEEGTCIFTLAKPGGEITYTLPYTKDAGCKTLKIGNVTARIENFEWADEIVLRYTSGKMPDGFISPWKVKMKLIEQ